MNVARPPFYSALTRLVAVERSRRQSTWSNTRHESSANASYDGWERLAPRLLHALYSSNGLSVSCGHAPLLCKRRAASRRCNAVNLFGLYKGCHRAFALRQTRVSGPQKARDGTEVAADLVIPPSEFRTNCGGIGFAFARSGAARKAQLGMLCASNPLAPTTAMPKA